MTDSLNRKQQISDSAQPEQEPVAYRVWDRMGGINFRRKKPEPTEYCEWDALYTTPPQRTWVGLTDEERNYIWNTVGNSDSHGDVDGRSGRDVMSAIEAKLKEKNTHD